MSQVFAADSVNNSAVVTLTLNTQSVACTGNFISPPFGNAKAIVSASASINCGTGVTSVVVVITRNPQKENVQIGPSFFNPAAASATVTVSVQFADVIPDSRAVQYAMFIQQQGATGNGSVVCSNISALLISG